MSATSRSYHVRAVLTSGGLWQGSVDELPGVTHRNRSLSQLETRMHAAISRHLAQGDDPAPPDITLELIPSTGSEDFDSQLSHARELRHRANELTEQARAAAEQARTVATPLAERLMAAGVSTRDAGSLLAVSASLIHSMIQSTS